MARCQNAVLLSEPACYPGERQFVWICRRILETATTRRDEMTHSIAWDRVTDAEVVRALKDYDQLGPERFFAEHGFGPTTTYDLVWNERLYPPKAILGTAYEFATGERLASGDFEGGKSGAVRVLGKLGFTVQGRR
jgi:hypothetical protein